MFDEIIAKYGNASFEELMNLTHEHAGYKVAWERRQGQRVPMYYEEMVDDDARRAALVEDIAPVSAHM